VFNKESFIKSYGQGGAMKQEASPFRAGRRSVGNCRFNKQKVY
jgi:hypothetical protein